MSHQVEMLLNCGQCACTVNYTPEAPCFIVGDFNNSIKVMVTLTMHTPPRLNLPLASSDCNVHLSPPLKSSKAHLKLYMPGIKKQLCNSERFLFLYLTAEIYKR